MQRDKLENPETRIILLSATPVVNSPYELALIYNLMRPNLFPNNESTFQQIFYSTANSEMINPEKKNMFQRRIMGLTSYYIGATPDLYATKKVHYKDLIMPEYFQQVYNVFEEIEEKREKLMRKLSKGNVGNEMATYSSYTRQASNFVFPYINSTINGENRPRPGDFRMDDEEAEILFEGKSQKKIKKLVQRETANKYLEQVNIFIKEFGKYLEEIKKRDKSSLINDIKNFEEKYEKDFSKFEKEEKNKSLLYETLYNSSPKMINIIFRILRAPGPTMVYSNYVNMEGLEIFKIYLKQFGFDDFNKTKNNSSYNFKRFIEFHGGVDKDIRTDNKFIFNQSDNKDGNVIKVILISPAGAEGINLANVRQVHLMEPYWNEGRMQQIIGRAIRQCSHKDLPIKERLVDVYRYKMIRTSKKLTTDQKMEDLARRKINLIESFLEAVRESAVDCGLFINHNMMGTKYNCFQFEQESVLSKNPGPAYKMDIELDSKINNGLNALGTKLKKLKVMKIKAVNTLENNNYSEEQFFWYDKNSNVIYDYDLHYPIGKIQLDDNNIPIKIKKDVYLVSYQIDIPTKLE
jgi:SNF2 family DNA or RNA helicase